VTAPVRWSYVCRLADIVPNTGVAAKVGHAQVAVFRIVNPQNGEEQVHAIGNRDPKSGAMVMARGLVGDVQGEPVVAAPVYKQHHSLRDGRCLEDPALAVPVYPVRVFEGMVLVRALPQGAGA
jgi:nitrite reductase (NADH) small subunit